MSEAEDLVAAGILQNPTRLPELDSVDHRSLFTSSGPRGVVSLALQYWRRAKGKNALDFALARSLLERSRSATADKVIPLLEEYESYKKITDPEFRDALMRLAKDRTRNVLRERNLDATEAMLKEDWEQAKYSMQAAIVEVEDLEIEDDRPRDIRSPEGAEEGRQQVDEISPLSERRTFDIGFRRIQERVSFGNKELTIIGGYSADGKSSLSKTIAYNANQRSDANVLFVALEMTRLEMQVMFTCQHAASLDPAGVRWADVLNRTATPEEMKLYRRALDDFEIKHHEDQIEAETREGGKLLIWAPSREINMRQFEQRVVALNHDVNLDIVIGDYLELIQPDDGHRDYRLHVKRLAERSKALARSSDLWMIQNHQISRRGRDEAEKRDPPHYLMRDLGESSGVERASDTILWIFSSEDHKSEREARVGIAKARKGKTLVRGFYVMADFERSVIAELAEDSE